MSRAHVAPLPSAICPAFLKLHTRALPQPTATMAASYWDSTQRRFWEFSKEQLAAQRQRRQEEERSLVQMCPLPEQRYLNMFFFQRRVLPFMYSSCSSPPGLPPGLPPLATDH